MACRKNIQVLITVAIIFSLSNLYARDLAIDGNSPDGKEKGVAVGKNLHLINQQKQIDKLQQQVKKK